MSEAEDAARYRFLAKHSRCELDTMGVDHEWYSPTASLDWMIDLAMRGDKYCRFCDGTGRLGTGIDEAPTTECKRCAGNGFTTKEKV